MKKYIQPEIKAIEIDVECICTSDTLRTNIWDPEDGVSEEDKDASDALSATYRTNLWN